MFIHKNTDELHSRYILAGTILVQPNVLHMNYWKLFFIFSFQTSLHLCYANTKEMMLPYQTFKNTEWEETDQEQSKKWRHMAMESYENVTMTASPLPIKSVTLPWKNKNKIALIQITLADSHRVIIQGPTNCLIILLQYFSRKWIKLTDLHFYSSSLSPFKTWIFAFSSSLTESNRISWASKTNCS